MLCAGCAGISISIWKTFDAGHTQISLEFYFALKLEANIMYTPRWANTACLPVGFEGPPPSLWSLASTAAARIAL